MEIRLSHSEQYNNLPLYSYIFRLSNSNSHKLLAESFSLSITTNMDQATETRRERDIGLAFVGAHLQGSKPFCYQMSTLLT
jgi:hypothetical protein